MSSTCWAIDGKRAVSQYLVNRWDSEQGMTGESVDAIAQTPDGYLWIGTEKGLLRFNGQTFRSVQPSDPVIQPINHVLSLAVDSGGNLWLRMRGSRVVRYHDGIFAEVLPEPQREAGVTAMARAADGGILLSTLSQGTLKFSGNAITTLSPPISPLVISIAEATDGKIWSGTREAGLSYWSHGRMSSVTKGLPDTKINCLLPADNGKLWIGTDNGLALWAGNEVSTQNIPSSLGHIQILTMTRDRDANLWVGTMQGLLRFNADGVSWFDEKLRAQSRPVGALFEDREGNIWVGDSEGIERIRDSAFNTYSTGEGLPTDNNGSIYVDSDDRIWAAPMQGGLFWMRNGSTHRVLKADLSTDIVYSIAGSANDVWLGRQHGGLTHMHIDGETITPKSYTHVDGLAQNSVYTVHQSRDGSVWAGTLSGGVSHLKDGKFTTYTTVDGLGSNTISSITEGLDGTMWFATSNGLSSLSNNHWRNYAMRDGLPSENVISLTEDAKGVLWIGTADGLASFSAGKLHPVFNMPQSLHEPIFAIEEDKTGSLWLTTAHHVFRINRQKLLYGKLADEDVREYGLADGLHGVEGVRRDRSIATDSHGRIWFSMNRGLSVMDPERTSVNSAPAIAHIENVSVDGNPVEMPKAIHIPSAHQRIAFNYTGLSFAAPERVQFRYKLDGFDRSWSEPVTTREATYTNLNPGSYRFRVMASNSAGLWSDAEASLPFSVDPAFWETWWFQLVCALTVVLAISLLYRLRMYQMIRRVNLRFEERLAERMRIAQELHDTLLQGFLSASMQLHIAADQIPEDSSAKPLLNRVLQLMGQVIQEGRTALRGLRSTDTTSLSLEQAFSRIPQELAHSHKVAYRVIVEGMPQPLHPLIRDEVYRIAREALVNAFRHAQASSIEVEIQYTASHLRISVRDDGCGIDPHILHTGREGHWGLPGMRERSEGIGAKLKVLSRTGAGTEVDLAVPGHIAYQRHAHNGIVKWLGKLNFRKARIVQNQEREP
jgi:ligand-binding sensor domain-containing protein/signal transduction histidine kinase